MTATLLLLVYQVRIAVPDIDPLSQNVGSRNSLTVSLKLIPSEPQEDHAVIMARFARDCKYKMNDVTRKLEVTLGPDTGDLRMRFGLHSGPVTAGVLRGEKSRFQLFGDTGTQNGLKIDPGMNCS